MSARVAVVLVLLVAMATADPFTCLVATLSNVAVNDTQTISYATVNVSQGSLRGKLVSGKSGREYYSFQGIPFAQPPVGDLRFKAPRPPQPWTGVRDATSEGPICTQFDNGAIRGSEDCLHLDVYTPQLPGTKGSGLLPVMVWIHGGGHFGSGNAVNYGPDFLVDKNVVVVNVNFRVGVLGFLNVRSSLSSQNNALKDQLAALKWVQVNIAEFGGDNSKVTIFGQSSGASSAEFLMLSPATRGLFHGAILHSGNAVDRWAYIEPSRARERAFILGRALGATTDNEDELVQFLSATPVEQLLMNQDSAFTEEDRRRSADIAFLPTAEELTAENTDILLPDSPVNILKSGRYHPVPYIQGFDEADAKMSYLAFLRSETWERVSSNMEQFVPPELKIPLGSPESLALASEIKQLYFGNVTPTVNNIRDLIELGTDAFFVQGVRRSARFRLRNSSTPVYVYQFSYVGGLSLSEFCQYLYPFRGAAHTDDLGYLFWMHRVNVTPSDRDITTRDRMTTMWTNFARTGNPNGNLDITWEPVTPTCENYLNIDDELSMRDLKELRPDKFAFWDRIYESFDN